MIHLKRTGTLLLSVLLFSFSPAKKSIDDCFLSYKGSEGLTAQPADQLPDKAKKSRMVKTVNGDVKISCIDGYRILYHNEQGAAFVNLKVELSHPKSYGADTTRLIQNLEYLNSASQGMETKDIIKTNFNGYPVYGLSRESIDEGSTLGIFLMFPGNDITVYFYFNAIQPEKRHFETAGQYKQLRDQFMNGYTSHLKTCLPG